jgi:arylsulfatase A-like enzyme
MNKQERSIVVFLLLALVFLSCSDREDAAEALRAKTPFHLEEHLDAATIVSSEVPEDVHAAVEWSFDKPRPDWKPVAPLRKNVKPVGMRQTSDALRLTLSKEGRFFRGGIYIDFPDWRREDWAYVLVRARTSDKIQQISLGFNLSDSSETVDSLQTRFLFAGEFLNVINDGKIHTYLMRTDWSWGEWKGIWKQLGIMVRSSEAASIDILSIRIVPKEANYRSAPAGVRTEVRNEEYRRSLYIHAPGKLEYHVQIPEAGRLDVDLGVLRENAPVTFRIYTKTDGGEPEPLLEETYSDKEQWAHRSVDLSHMAGQAVTLVMEAEAERIGTVALWGAPTLAGIRDTDKPNIILYIIDGAGADFMSVYGYNRRTTPNLERLAAEGAVFEHAYSNSTWTRVSNPSFMTSFYHSVLGGWKTDSDPLPEKAVTIAQHLHRGGYQTGVFTTNAYCGTISSLERGVDVLREAGIEQNSISSEVLHKDFWKWRDAFPGEPYWVHFQTTDVHWPWKPPPPFAGLFIRPQQRETFHEWKRTLAKASEHDNPWPNLTQYPPAVFKKTGISRVALFDAARSLYDETMAHNDYQIGKLVERLKASGEWEHTLLIIAADHGIDYGLGIFDQLPPFMGSPLFRSCRTRIPMIIIWPERIAPGQRFSQPVSMIDMLPTILDLAGIEQAEHAQGQSLAPLLLGRQGWDPRPVIFDEFYVDWDTGEISGLIEMIDGKWGASLWIKPSHGDDEKPPEQVRPDLLLYDIWNDPYCLHSLHEERPDLVKKYTDFLERQWKEHRTLARRFKRADALPLTAEQLRTLRSLGYIQ